MEKKEMESRHALTLQIGKQRSAAKKERDFTEKLFACMVGKFNK